MAHPEMMDRHHGEDNPSVLDTVMSGFQQVWGEDSKNVTRSESVSAVIEGFYDLFSSFVSEPGKTPQNSQHQPHMMGRVGEPGQRPAPSERREFIDQSVLIVGPKKTSGQQQGQQRNARTRDCIDKSILVSSHATRSRQARSSPPLQSPSRGSGAPRTSSHGRSDRHADNMARSPSRGSESGPLSTQQSRSSSKRQGANATTSWMPQIDEDAEQTAIGEMPYGPVSAQAAPLPSPTPSVACSAFAPRDALLAKLDQPQASPRGASPQARNGASPQRQNGASPGKHNSHSPPPGMRGDRMRSPPPNATWEDRKHARQNGARQADREEQWHRERDERQRRGEAQRREEAKRRHDMEEKQRWEESQRRKEEKRRRESEERQRWEEEQQRKEEKRRRESEERQRWEEAQQREEAHRRREAQWFEAQQREEAQRHHEAKERRHWEEAQQREEAQRHREAQERQRWEEAQQRQEAQERQRREEEAQQKQIDSMDLLDQHVIHYLQTHPEVQKKFCIEWVSPCHYNMNGREIQVTWQHSPDPGNPGYLMIIDGPLHQPFADYMQNLEHTAVYNNKGIRSTNLHLTAKETRMTFQDSHEKYSRIDAMKVAKEQAAFREQAAHFAKTGQALPTDFMDKYQKTISMKLAKSKDKNRRSRTSPPPQTGLQYSDDPQKQPVQEKENVATGVKPCATMMKQNGVEVPVGGCATMMKAAGAEVAAPAVQKAAPTPSDPSATQILNPCVTMAKINGAEAGVAAGHKLTGISSNLQVSPMYGAAQPNAPTATATQTRAAFSGINPSPTMLNVTGGASPAKTSAVLNPCATQLLHVSGAPPAKPSSAGLHPCTTMAKGSGLEAAVAVGHRLNPCITMGKVNGADVAVAASPQLPAASADRKGMPGLNPCVTMAGVGAQQTPLRVHNS